MRYKATILLTMAAALLFTQGCSFPEAYPIEDQQHILIAGIDTLGDDVILTVFADSTAPGGKEGEEKIQYKLFTAREKTMFEADSTLNQVMEKRPSWHHTKYVIIGEEAAKTDVDRLFSFFMENHETRLLYRIAVVKGMSAKDFLQQANTGKESLSDYLDTLFSATDETGKSQDMHLINYAAQRDIPWVSFYMPVLELYKNPTLPGRDSGGGESGGDTGDRPYLIALNGFALFSGDTFAGFISGDISRGLNIITNDIKHSGMGVKDRQGNNVGLELMECNSNIIPCFDPLSATIRVSFQSNLVEYDTVDPLNENDIKYLERQQSELILGEVSQAVKRMRELKSDPARIMDAFYHNDPVKWQSVKDDWLNAFLSLEITIEVDSKILNTYELIKPIGK